MFLRFCVKAMVHTEFIKEMPWTSDQDVIGRMNSNITRPKVIEQATSHSTRISWSQIDDELNGNLRLDPKTGYSYSTAEMNAS